MFRIFLRKKILSGTTEDKATARRSPTRMSRQRNRRLFERYNVDQQHLTILNDQDILVIRDISAKGFSSDVSERAFERFNVGDHYDARMRYLGEIHDLQIKVTWKRNKAVGFELVDASRETLAFLRRLLKPIEVANSLKQVDAEFIRNNAEGKVWFHGDNETDLFIWRLPSGEMHAWQLVVGKEFVEWNNIEGVSTGVIAYPPQSATADSLTTGDPLQVRDKGRDSQRVQFATDVLMAMQSDLKEDLLATITG